MFGRSNSPGLGDLGHSGANSSKLRWRFMFTLGTPFGLKPPPFPKKKGVAEGGGTGDGTGKNEEDTSPKGYRRGVGCIPEGDART